MWQILSEGFYEFCIAPIIARFQFAKEALYGIVQEGWAFVQGIWACVTNWFEENLAGPLMFLMDGTKAGVVSALVGAWDDIRERWQGVCAWFEEHVTAPFRAMWEVTTTIIGGYFETLWALIKGKAAGALNSLIGMVEYGVNRVITTLNVLISGFNRFVTGAAAIVGADWGGVDLISYVSLPRIQMYQFGGFPTPASLFWAGERGIPELLGTVGGRTAVAGGAEITGISDTIRMVSSQEMKLMQEQNQLLRKILEKNYGITERELFNSVRRSADDYYRRTGREAFLQY